MNSRSDVAVVIPTHTPGPWLEPTIRSVLAQTAPPAEIVVVDDGSKEPLDARLAEFRSHILLARQANAGPGAARNRGVSLTEASYLAFLDDDDLWEADKLERQVRFLDEHPECGMVAGEVREFGDGIQLRPKPRCGDSPVPDLTVEGLLAGNPIATVSVVMRRSVFDAVGGFCESWDCFAVEDYDLWLRVAATTRIGWIPEFVARYRRHESSISNPCRFLENGMFVLERARRRLAGTPELAARIRKRRGELLRDYAWARLENGQAVRAFAPIVEALGLTPGDARVWRLLARAALATFKLTPHASLTPGMPQS